ncbi:ABC transporter permease subunit [Enterococcus saccharolyticus]|uniref:ABC transporter permease subunit n=1 Tax=Enterococcus TaxID=1350 RepID=UPI001E5FABCE|nr:ABC transporter permease subunit [Enterococcus saccharolyticus]MCD5003192.1 ABC transporter permease subunit [Enterococcus saccharolyticus]
MSQRFSLEGLLRIFLLLFFACFLFVPLIQILLRATIVEGQFSLVLIQELFQDSQWITAFGNSLLFSIVTAIISTILGFLLAYGMNFTQISSQLKRSTHQILLMPMLLPTITYGFVLIYSFGKQGLWSRLFGRELFTIYGTNGVILGLVIYSLPVTFLLMNDAMQYIDKRYLVVSRLMKDHFWRGLKVAVLQPLTKVFGVAIVQSFFMSFTDFGIPVAVGGQKVFITTLLYEYFMGSLPDFERGAVIALSMLLPSIASILLLKYLQKKEVFYDQKSLVVVRKNTVRDVLFSLLLIGISVMLLLVFFTMFFIPFVKVWTYDFSFTLAHWQTFFTEPTLLLTLKNGLWVALLTATFGTMTAYLAAVFTARSKKKTYILQAIDSFSTITNSVPGMVLGIAYLLIFSGTTIHNTFAILVIVNVIHYFSTPYQMAKSALQKMNPNWENTTKIMGDRWLDSLYRIIIPNSKITILEMFSYYFTNAMVTISAVIFLTSANTMVITTKIKELQHFGRFTDIFILSIILLTVNLFMRIIIQFMTRRMKINEKNINKRSQRSFRRSNGSSIRSLWYRSIRR